MPFIIFNSKYEKARKLQRRDRGLDEDLDIEIEEDFLQETEKGDVFAMIVAAFGTIFVPVLLILLGIVAVGLLFVQVF